jgi:hypothetical protein
MRLEVELEIERFERFEYHYRIGESAEEKYIRVILSLFLFSLFGGQSISDQTFFFFGWCNSIYKISL